MTLQALIDATPTDSVCTLPAGVHAQSVPLVVNRSMTLDGNGCTLQRDVADGTPMLDLNGLGDNTRVTIRDLTITGPDTTTWDQTLDVPTAAIDWSTSRTWSSTLALRNVTTSGGFGAGVIRSGGGALDIAGCDLSGWESGVKFFESHGGHGKIVMRDTTLAAPARSKFASVGTYIHPHLDTLIDSCVFTGWGRYAVYLNGSMTAAGHHDLIDVAAVDCSLIQTGGASTTTLVRCVESGTPGNGGSLMRGQVLSVGSVWCGSGLISTDGNYERRFVGDYIAPQRLWAAFGRKSVGTLTVVGCHVQLDGTGSLLTSVAGSQIAAKIVDTTIVENGTARALIVQGGTVDLIDTPMPARVTVTAPGVVT